jgi:uncharacterized protein YbjQ (UPF0145 family)
MPNNRNNGSSIKILTIMDYDKTKYTPVKTISVFHVIALSSLRSFTQGLAGFLGSNNLKSTGTKFEEARQNAEKKLRIAAVGKGDLIVGANFNISEMGEKNSILVCHAYGTLLKKIQ